MVSKNAEVVVLKISGVLAATYMIDRDQASRTPWPSIFSGASASLLSPLKSQQTAPFYNQFSYRECADHALKKGTSNNPLLDIALLCTL